MTEYLGPSWAIELDAGWSGVDEEECHTFTKEDGVGALQVSSYRRSDTDEVTDADLRAFIPPDELARAEATPVRFSSFIGLRLAFVDDDTAWRKWVLRNGHTIVLATYVCERSDVGAEAIAAEDVLRTIRPIHIHVDSE